jgi:hypothetical protein
VVTTRRNHLVELSDFARRRLEQRMAGLTDAEYLWESVPHCRTVHRRGDDTFRSDGPPPSPPSRGGCATSPTSCARSATARGSATPSRRPGSAPATRGLPRSLADLADAHGCWREILTGTTEESLGEPIGPRAGYHRDSTRRAVALHVLDELIHHGAEAALLRDLYAATGAGTTGLTP